MWPLSEETVEGILVDLTESVYKRVHAYVGSRNRLDLYWYVRGLIQYWQRRRWSGPRVPIRGGIESTWSEAFRRTIERYTVRKFHQMLYERAVQVMSPEYAFVFSATYGRATDRGHAAVRESFNRNNARKLPNIDYSLVLEDVLKAAYSVVHLGRIDPSVVELDKATSWVRRVGTRKALAMAVTAVRTQNG